MSQAVREIQALVAAYYGMSTEKLLSKQRTRDVCRPRQVAAWLCKQLTSASLPKIGKMFGLDHTTVMSSIKRIDKLMENNLEVRCDVNTLKAACAKATNVIAARRIAAAVAHMQAVDDQKPFRAGQYAAHVLAFLDHKRKLEMLDKAAGLLADGASIEAIADELHIGARKARRLREAHKESADAQAA